MGHQIGPAWDVPHGFTSAIMLPHVMRFMADVAPQRFGPIAEGFGIPFHEENEREVALRCADRAAEFIAQFNIPTRLRDVEVPRTGLSRIAGTVLNEIVRAKTVDRDLTAADINALLEAAY
jgi:alcohol dehydrogenase class IV